MKAQYALEGFKESLERINARVDEAIGGLGTYSTSPTWERAVRALLAISRAPKHLFRSQLVLLGSLAAGGPVGGAELERFAAGVELLHLFMLVHDDEMDEATMRRGQPTVQVALKAPSVSWQQAQDLAIVMGNLLHVVAVRHLLPSGVKPARGATPGELAACELMLEALCRAGVGQFQDLLGFKALRDEEALRKNLIDKSAHHSFAAPLASGVLLVSPEADVSRALAWGHHLGLAFQALDDLADLVASPALTGKDGLRDLVEGRPTVPLFLLLQRVSGEDRALLESLVGAGSIEPGERAMFDALLRRSGVVEGCAGWVRSEIAAATREREAARFPALMHQGLRTFEQGLEQYLEEVLAIAAQEHGDGD